MTRRLRDERGLTLIEVLVASTIFLFVLGASLTVFDAVHDDHVRVERHNDAQDAARLTTDRLARELRNLASPTDLSNPLEAQPNAVDVAEPFDLVFRSVADVKPAASANSPNARRIRYCVDDGAPTGELWMQWQTWTTAGPPPVPSRTACPGDGWDGQRRMTTGVVNRQGAAPRPLFTYDASVLQEITRVRTDVLVDPLPGAPPAATRLSTAVLLRNQNQFPVAAFDATWVNVTSRTVLLNAYSSSDPEGQPLRYCWFLNPSSTPVSCTGALGDGATLTLTLPTGPQRVVLLVQDPARLRDVEERTFA